MKRFLEYLFFSIQNSIAIHEILGHAVAQMVEAALISRLRFPMRPLAFLN
jgi:hypothetical protein